MQGIGLSSSSNAALAAHKAAGCAALNMQPGVCITGHDRGRATMMLSFLSYYFFRSIHTPAIFPYFPYPRGDIVGGPRAHRPTQDETKVRLGNDIERGREGGRGDIIGKDSCDSDAVRLTGCLACKTNCYTAL